MHPVLSRYHEEVLQELHRALHIAHTASAAAVNEETLCQLYGQMQYHLGWVDHQFRPAEGNSGKLLRPKLLLLSYELSVAQAQGHVPASHLRAHALRPVLPAAAAIELAHNFTLLHDDIQDGDVERRHRPTVWSVWGIPQAILVGDALLALTRLHLWKVLDVGVEPATALQLAHLLDTALLEVIEGQHLDMAFERQHQVTLTHYKEMISRKTAALMGCATAMGATLGTCHQGMIEGLARFGHAFGLAFQIRDDMSGVWATEAAGGKRPAGDILRRKKSLPLLHALHAADPEEQRMLAKLSTQAGPVTEEQVQEVLTILAWTQTKTYCTRLLVEQCQLARVALAHVAPAGTMLATQARADLEALIDVVEGG